MTGTRAAPWDTEPAAHPLDPLTAAEITAARRIPHQAGRVTDTTRFPLVLLDEPARHTVASHRAGDPVVRRVRVTLLDSATGGAAEALVDLTAGVELRYRPLDADTDGQPPVLFEEYDLVEEVVRADPAWRAAMSDRGVTDPSLALAAPIACGDVTHPEHPGRRLLRALTFMRCDATDNPWAHPVAGLVADVDLADRRVVRLVDTGAVPIPAECGRYEPEFTSPHRADLRPLRITQPDGPSFSLDGHRLRWQNWDLTLWHVVGPTHLPRPEDWPVMPVDHAGFTLRPTGFFDRNPAPDLPPETAAGQRPHCPH